MDLPDKPPTSGTPVSGPNSSLTIAEENAIWETDSDSNRIGPGSSRSDRRYSSSASTSSASNRDVSPGSNGRRTRPSVTSISSTLPTVRELREKRQSSFTSLSSDLSSARKPSDGTVVSSKKVLTNFEKVAARNPEIESSRLTKLAQYNTEHICQRGVYDRLLAWADSDCRRIKNRILGLLFRRFRRPPLPSTTELMSLAQHYYPARADLKVEVCDFGPGRAERTEISLGQVEEVWQGKPDWRLLHIRVDVRWIHAPLGLGLTHSSVEDIFLHDGKPGREFENGGRSGWPFLETEVLNIRSHRNFQEMRDVYLILRQITELEDELNDCNFKNDGNSSLQPDIHWRAGHLSTTANYWNLVSSDMPWQLTEGLSMGLKGPMEGLQPITRYIDEQALSTHPFYRDCHMVRNPFRCFHRSDGFLLTLSPMAGVNFLDTKLCRHLSEPIETIFDNENASALGYVFSAFADSGTDTWHKRTVEWFLTYLITEVGVTPHPMRQGYNAPGIETAYQAVIQDLKRRRHAPWRKNETVKLVRDYLCCVDELTTVKSILQKKVELFKGMQQDVRRFESEDNRARKPVNNPSGESAHERVKWALTMAKDQHDCFERLLLDTKQSMEALFQLRSIEQNELAIVSDSQNKAILLFTGVTIVFLPLSFFTSYFEARQPGYSSPLSALALRPAHLYREWFTEMYK
ncbi:MAG: hypothetical protein LQ351_007598 [Letrouitia transgressa]|nr:MAG: hypothetical protein LQ351_007598 [Letrouitia transgressa]